MAKMNKGGDEVSFYSSFFFSQKTGEKGQKGRQGSAPALISAPELLSHKTWIFTWTVVSTSRVCIVKYLVVREKRGEEESRVRIIRIRREKTTTSGEESWQSSRKKKRRDPLDQLLYNSHQSTKSALVSRSNVARATSSWLWSLQSFPDGGTPLITTIQSVSVSETIIRDSRWTDRPASVHLIIKWYLILISRRNHQPHHPVQHQKRTRNTSNVWSAGTRVVANIMVSSHVKDASHFSRDPFAGTWHTPVGVIATAPSINIIGTSVSTVDSRSVLRWAWDVRVGFSTPQVSSSLFPN